ncbi:hypothetical protein BT67DRAFT_255813 [Trichocladium antarcticum]|uniref:Stc1 domain-containing protein n=1 Tax=Trichocladium antarcticum TaxID=1450529 RepID=A0AAN6UMT7_9PEZI|nr:hypothetical protein BT67DRAFT_255813 [Trichocladium antarcticum]
MASTQRSAGGSTLRCQRGGEWAARDQFSQNQLDKFTRKARQGIATPENTGISCRAHSPQSIQELTCEGPCGRRRELYFFSKSTRRKGTNWCRDCVDYQECLEVGASLPPPNSLPSFDEPTPALEQTLLPMPALPNNTMSVGPGASVAESTISGDDGTSTLGSTDSTLPLPDVTPTTNDPILDKFIPPHLRILPPIRAPHWHLPPLDDEPWGLAGTSEPSVTTLGTLSNEDAVTFNAWGSNGEFTRMVKVPTVASTSATETGEPVRVKKGGWAKPPTRKFAPQLPDYLKTDNHPPAPPL